MVGASLTNMDLRSIAGTPFFRTEMKYGRMPGAIVNNLQVLITVRKKNCRQLGKV